MTRSWTVGLVAFALLGAAKEPAHESEVIDQPPAAAAARDNPLARAAPATVQTGPYVSIQVNVDAQGMNIVGDAANEPSIAVNPTNPSNMVIGWRQFDSVASNFRQAGWAYTFDAGQHWTFPGSLTPGIFRSDPVIDVSSSGVFYYQSLLGSPANFKMDTFKSTDGGVTWGPPVPSFGGDKNWMAVDRSGGEGHGTIYGIWQRFAPCCSTSILTKSTNGGASFEPPAYVPMSPFFGMIAVGPDSRLYATGGDGTAGQDLTHIVVARSADAWHPDNPPNFLAHRIELGGRLLLSQGPNPAGLLGQSNIAADHSNGATRGNVYVVASVKPAGPDPLDVHFTKSLDGGNRWYDPVRVNDDASTTNWQWLAAHAVAPNGRIDVVWFDTRESGVAHISRLYYSYSWDTGATWSPNVAVSPAFNSHVGWPNQGKMGDYTTLVSDATGASVAYAATFSGGQDVWYVRLFPDCNANGVSDVADLDADTSFDCNLDHLPDECGAAPSCIGAGSVQTVAVAKAGGDVALTWGPSCAAADGDFAVYEGTLGDFATHQQRTCTTSGAPAWTLTPSPASAYYLVVPVHADREGSYGGDSSGAERPSGQAACRPQSLSACGG